ncbi:YdcF family protein [Nocardia asteroides]|uniref:YdcF family protein n=1 Tax=Nocardia asteroides TaxID=1824 RepID=UPI00343ABF95
MAVWLTLIAGYNALGSPAQEPPGRYGRTTAVVILGYGLSGTGEMRDELMRRLRTGLAQAVLSPESPIIVTGGNPQSGISEADAMAAWLTAQGIPAHRILVERDARNTVENALRTGRLMDERQIETAVLVTSQDHLGWARAVFAAVGITVIADLTPDGLAGYQQTIALRRGVTK